MNSTYVESSIGSDCFWAYKHTQCVKKYDKWKNGKFITPVFSSGIKKFQKDCIEPSQA